MFVFVFFRNFSLEDRYSVFAGRVFRFNVVDLWLSARIVDIDPARGDRDIIGRRLCWPSFPGMRTYLVQCTYQVQVVLKTKKKKKKS